MDEMLLTARTGTRQVRYAAAGPPGAPKRLLLVHAFPLGVRMWAPQLAAVDTGEPGPGWRVLAVGLPGFDGSDLPDEQTMDTYARAAFAVLDQEGIPAAAVCGLSLGGYVAFAMLRQAPERIRQLVLADTRAGADSEEAAAGRRRMLELIETGGPSAVAEDMLPKLLGESSMRDHPELASTVRELIGAQPPAAIAAATHAMMGRPDSMPLLPTIRIPTLVVVGQEDTLTPPAEAQKIHAAIPGARYVQIPGAGHLSNLENPDVFNEVVGGFLRE